MKPASNLKCASAFRWNLFSAFIYNLKGNFPMKYSVILITILLYLAHLPVSFSHGSGGSTFSSRSPNTHTPQEEQVEKIKPASERMVFTLKIHENVATLQIDDNSNKPMDTSIASATVVVTGDTQPGMFKMMPAKQGYIKGTIPMAISSTTKFEVTLRMPGERPINISFIPKQGSKSINIRQQASHH